VRRSVGRAAIYGALIGLATAAVAEAVRPRGGTTALVDWDQVRRAARARLETPALDRYELEAAAKGYRGMAAELEKPLLNFVGGLPKGRTMPKFEALDRAGWLDLNLGILRRVIDPVLEAGRVPNSLLMEVGRTGVDHYVAFMLAFIGSLAFAAGAVGVSAAPSVKAAPATMAATAAAAPPTLSDKAGDRRTEGRPGCRFERPEVWPAGSGPVSWIGRCRNGFADGSGVILEIVEGAELERFYGRIQGGYLSVGVLQTPSGFMAGTWANGALADPLANDVAQRNTLIAAFRAAADAATSVSKSFAKKGDPGASRYYAKQAKLLREQMD